MGRVILNVAFDAAALEERTALLREHGFEVLSATNLLDVITACENNDLEAVVLGPALPIKEKVRITATVSKSCAPKPPIIGLYEKAVSEADGADRAVPAHDTAALLQTLATLLRKPPKKAE
jgi:DNA-binding response OmpR family regulator